jgi:hypothetical protein
MRLVGAGLPNYAQGITTAARCLKPGGILIIGEFDMNSCAEDMVSSQKMALDTPDEAGNSWIQRYRYGGSSSSPLSSCFSLIILMRFVSSETEFRWANAVNGTDIFQAEEMLDHGLWGHPLLDHCGAGSLFTPLGPWPTCMFPYHLLICFCTYL